MQETTVGNEENFTSQSIGYQPIALAVGLGCAWALLAVFLGYRLGWLALPIGLGLGICVYKLRITPLRNGAWLALWLTVLALVVARVLSCAGGAWYVSGHEIHADPYLVYDAVLAEVSTEGPTISEGRLTEREIHSEVMARMGKLTAGQKRSLVRGYIHASDTPVVRKRSPHGWFRLWDVIWWGIALRIAFGLGGADPGLDDELVVIKPGDGER